MIDRAELVALLAKVKPTRLALVDEDGKLEWLAVPRGKLRWERLVDKTIGARAWSELRLCDARGATMEVVEAAAAADDAPDVTPPAATSDPAAHFASLLTTAVMHTVKVTTAAIESTVKTMRTEARQEQAELLSTYSDMARDAFALRAQDAADLAVERDRRLQLEQEVAELRALVKHAPAADDAAEQSNKREATLLQLLQGGGAGGGSDPSQGMPQGG